MVIRVDNPVLWVVESIPTVKPADRDVLCWLDISKLCAALENRMKGVQPKNLLFHLLRVYVVDLLS